jgi:hypothetical protein
MNLQQTFAHVYPEGSLGGECGDFAHKLVEFPPVGDSIQEKMLAVKAHGFVGNYQVGDVLIFDVGTPNGHVATINADLGDVWQLSESNWNLDLRVHHGRTIPKTKPIVGGFRGALKVPIYFNPFYMKIRIINNYSITDLTRAQVAQFIATASKWSGGVLNLVVDTIYTNFQNIPYVSVGEAAADSENPQGLAASAVAFAWMLQNPALMAQDVDVYQFWIADSDWKGNVNGVCDIAQRVPMSCQCHLQDATEPLNLSSTGYYEATMLGLHELRHTLCAIGRLTDDTHAWLTQGKLDQSFLPENLDYPKIESGLVVLRSAQAPIAGSPYPQSKNFSAEQLASFTSEVQAAIKLNDGGAHNRIVNDVVGYPW